MKKNDQVENYAVYIATSVAVNKGPGVFVRMSCNRHRQSSCKWYVIFIIVHDGKSVTSALPLNFRFSLLNCFNYEQEIGKKVASPSEEVSIGLGCMMAFQVQDFLTNFCLSDFPTGSAPLPVGADVWLDSNRFLIC